MSWGYLMREHAKTLWDRLKTMWLTRGLERKQRAARGIVGKRPNHGKPLHVPSRGEK
jgi:hypothetical protein